MVSAQRSQAGAECLAPRTSPLVILLAEDSRVTRHLVQLVLSKRGHDVDVVEDGERALDALQSRTYDVVLMDFHLPKVDGLQVAKQFKSKPSDGPHPHFIGITADIEGLLAFPDDCESLDLVIGKPIDIVQLCGVVEDFEGHKHRASRLDRHACLEEGDTSEWLPYDGIERRSAPRLKIEGGSAMLTLRTGECFPCHVRELSLIGALLEVEARPPVGELVVLGRTKGRVVRHTQTGIALEFPRAGVAKEL